MTLEALAPSVWTLAIPHRFLGLEIGTRMNVVRLADGGLLVHSPVPAELSFGPSVSALSPQRETSRAEGKNARRALLRQNHRSSGACLAGLDLSPGSAQP